MGECPTCGCPLDSFLPEHDDQWFCPRCRAESDLAICRARIAELEATIGHLRVLADDPELRPMVGWTCAYDADHGIPLRRKRLRDIIDEAESGNPSWNRTKQGGL